LYVYKGSLRHEVNNFFAPIFDNKSIHYCVMLLSSNQLQSLHRRTAPMPSNSFPPAICC